MVETTVEDMGSSSDPLRLHAARRMLLLFEEALAGGSRAALHDVAVPLIERVVV